MYQPFFGLAQAPFSIAPDPRYLFMSERHREALAHLLYGLEGGGGFVLLSGEIGAGKTTVCRCFLEQVPAHCNVAYIFNPKLSVTELLKTVCDEFGIAVGAADSVKAFIDPLNAWLLAAHAAGRHSVLIIDEAQNLSAEVLEQLRLLTNLETRERKLLQIILIGQPELRQMLARPELEQLAQRVIARFHLGPLSEAETAQYIAHRLAVAGRAGALPFDAAALRRIHHWARGVPRRINLLADRALLGAYAGGQAQVGRAIVDRAAAEVFGEAPRPSAQRLSRALPPLLVAVAAGAVALGWAGRQAALPVAPAVSRAPVLAASPASAASAGAAVAVVAPTGQASPASAASALPPPEALDPAEPRWRTLDEPAAWRALAAQWPALAAAEQPCTAPGWACVRGRLTLPQLQGLDRPVLLMLGEGRGQPVLLRALDDSAATLQAAGEPVRVSLSTLALAWRGEYAALWQPPPGYQVAPVDGQSGPVLDWLAAGLARWRGEPAPAPGTARLDAALRAQVMAFQRAQGLEVDGVAGPGTCMQLQRLLGEPGPRLRVPTAPAAAAAPNKAASDVLHP